MDPPRLGAHYKPAYNEILQAIPTSYMDEGWRGLRGKRYLPSAA